MKRNLGLALAKMCQWTRILFLDDDISLSPEKVRSAARLLADYPVVGFQVKNFPVDSVMGHAKRLTGWEQDVFISGGSLLVDPQRLNGFFPSIYHADWFCVLTMFARELWPSAAKSSSCHILRSRAQCVQYWKSSGIFSAKDCSG